MVLNYLEQKSPNYGKKVNDTSFGDFYFVPNQKA